MTNRGMVGAPFVLPPDLAAFLPGVRETEPEEVARITQLGVPADIASFSSFWPMNPRFPPTSATLPGAVVVLRVGGSGGPPRTLEELAAVRTLGLGLDLALQDGFDLRSLSGLIDRAPHLTIQGVGIQGWEVLSQAHRLRSCNLIADPPERISLDSLPALDYVMALSPESAFAAGSPSARTVKLDLQEWPEGLVLGECVEHLEIWGAARIERLPPMRNPESLRILDLRGAVASFDVQSLLPAQNLRDLMLGSCARVLGCEALLDLPALERVFIGDCKELPEWETLSSLRVERFDLPGQRFGRKSAIEALCRTIMS